MDFDFDLALAKQLQIEEEKLARADKSGVSKKPNNVSIVDPQWETIDPNPNIFSLFQTFDAKFFWSKLGSVEIKWSPRMYSCAGICTYKGRGGCVISLSLPLLKLRPRKDLVETLLHEMIHAYLFLTKNNRDRDGHGPEFQKHMHRINNESGTKITIYHSFHDEVRLYKTHWWRCEGPCRDQKPFFGMVKRSMNRAPGPNDFWFAEHQSRCGGKFVKIKEPDGFKSRKPKNEWIKSKPLDKHLVKTNEIIDLTDKPNVSNQLKNFVPFVGKGHVLGEKRKLPTSEKPSKAPKLDPKPSTSKALNCPACNKPVLTDMNEHLDSCVTLDSIFDASNDFSIDNTQTEDANVQCPICSMKLKKDQVDSHVEVCLSTIAESFNDPFDSIPIKNIASSSNSSPNQTSKVNCPICGLQFLMEEINAHIDICVQ